MFSQLYTIVALGLALSGGAFAVPTAENSLAALKQRTGTATYYFQGGAYGACGKKHSDADYIVALSPKEYAKGANCGKTIRIKNTKTGVTHTGVIADLCPGCRTTGSIDLSQGLFHVFATEEQGVFPVAWDYV